MKFICLLGLLVSLHSYFAYAESSPDPDRDRDMFIAHLLEQMTLDEKVGQLVMDYAPPQGQADTQSQRISSGQIGAIFDAGSRVSHRELQNAAIRARLKIPLFFGFDVIHGHRTVFPIDLGLAASWDLKAIAMSGRVAAQEASADGIDMTFAPMVDITRDPRWGRVAEGFGEDTYLVSQIAAVLINAFQGPVPIANNRVMASVKHFALYGAAEGGRDYNSVDMSAVQMYQTYLPPFQAAIDAKAGAVMLAYNSINGVPAAGDSWLLRDVLRKQWKFKGMTIGDLGDVKQLIKHGFARDQREASKLAMIAGMDLSLVDTFYGKELALLVRSKEIPMILVDNAVRNVLTAKYEMGLFEDPYRRIGNAREDPPDVNAPSRLHRDQARDVARRTLVLLKNKNSILPLKRQGTIALIGPLAKSSRNILGSWPGKGLPSQAVSVYDGLARALGRNGTLIYARGANFTDDPVLMDYVGDQELENDSRPAAAMIEEAVNAAAQADVVIAVLGESANMSGETASRSSLDIPGRQRELLGALSATGKPLILLLMNGRPLSIGPEQELADAVVETWFSGTEGGNAIADVLFGDYNPSGKLPITFARSVGQIPVYYNHLNTGHPFISGNSPQYSSGYMDLPTGPLYPFGYGLSYTDFSLSEVKLSSATLTGQGVLDASISVKNVGQRDGETVVQLYVQQLVGSLSRPVKELKGFQKVMLASGEERVIHFQVSQNDLRFFDAKLNFAAEPGVFNVQIGLDSQHVKQQSFQLL